MVAPEALAAGADRLPQLDLGALAVNGEAGDAVRASLPRMFVMAGAGEIRMTTCETVLRELEHLAPAERVAFVLHDVFAVPFDDVAAILGAPRR